MNTMWKNVLAFGIGYFIARNFILDKGTAKYLKEESKVIDKIRNRLHNFIKNQSTEDIDDDEVSKTVMQITKI